MRESLAGLPGIIKRSSVLIGSWCLIAGRVIDGCDVDVQADISVMGVLLGMGSHHHQELEDTLFPNTAEPPGQTPCTQRKKASFRFRLCGC